MSAIRDCLLLVGIALTTYGFAKIHLSLALVFFGVALVSICLLIARHKQTKKPEVIVNSSQNDN